MSAHPAPLFAEKLTVRLVLPGPPRTKKTSNRIVKIPKKGGGRGFSKILPSKAFCAWEGAVAPQVAAAWRRAGGETIEVPVNCKAMIFRDANRGDAVGYYQGIADVLQKAGVVSDDKWIVSWDGTRLAIDRKNPRVEVLLEEVR
jgi:Holliday junction resolvase RusA-like endonuclease